MRKIILVLSLSLLLGCGGTKSDLTKMECVPVESRMKIEKVCELKENINFLGNEVKGLNFIDDNHFSIVSMSVHIEDNTRIILDATPSTIFVYNTNGEQVKEINKSGKGPGEYLRIDNFQVINDKSYLYCGGAKKMNIYDYQSDTLIHSFQSVNKWGISVIAYYKDKIIFNNLNHPEDILLDIYSNKGEFLKSIGKYSFYGEFLNCFNSNSRMFIRDEKLYYIYSDTLGYSCLNMNDYSVESYKIEDPNFLINRNITKKDARERGFDRTEYVFNNSAVNSIYPYKDGALLEVFHGTMEMKDGVLSNMNSRYVAYYYFDKDNKFKERVVFSDSDQNVICGLTPYNGNLYKLKFEGYGTENEAHVLYKVDFL